MSDFNQDMQNLLNAYNSNWEDYLILREQFIEKYSLSVEKLQEIRVEELKDFNSKILQAELKNQKLQEQNKTMKLALVELSDENIYDNTGFFSDEYAKNLVEQLDAGEIETIVERCNRNLQEQLNTAKKALTEIINIPESDNYFDCEECIVMMEESAKQALAAIEKGENNEI